MLQATRRPRPLLWIDAMGASLTCVLTYFLLASELVPTGIPSKFLCGMALAAGLFCLIGFLSARFSFDARQPLRWMAFLNVTYCIVSLILCAVYSQTLTRWGILYFCSEVAIIIPLAIWEWRVSSRPC